VPRGDRAQATNTKVPLESHQSHRLAQLFFYMAATMRVVPNDYGDATKV
jgi:hypothetical protein